MKLKATAILFMTGLFVLMTSPVLAQDEALYVAPSGNVGLGLNNPARQLHLKGSNAVFRMDRNYDTAAFLMVRTDVGGTPLKTFVVGTNASGSNTGEFIINDLGNAVSGGGARRMTIQNNGDVVFTGNVFAANIASVSSIRFKDNIHPIEDSLALAQQLQGVRFDWKASGKPALGLIAEDVEAVLPEVVAHDPDTGEVMGLNYDAIVPVLLEALKEQQANYEAQQVDLEAQRQRVAELERQVLEYQSVQARVAELEALVLAKQAETVLVNN